MDTKLYGKLLLRLLLMPFVAALLLAIALGYSLQRVERSARWVDHSDEVIAGGNRLIKLMVDEETGVRGYLITQNTAFLEPYSLAERELPEEFDRLYAMVRDNPEQSARLQRLRTNHDRWEIITRQQLATPNHNLLQDMATRKLEMDRMRSQADRFVRREEILRDRRSKAAEHVGNKARLIVSLLLALVGVVAIWATQHTFLQLRHIFEAQLKEEKAQRDLAYAREQWLNTTLRSIGDAVIACDESGCVVFMNPVAEQMTGWTEQEAEGHPLPHIFHIVTEHTRAIVENPVEKVRRTGTIVGLGNHTILVRKDGTESNIDDSGSPIRDADGKMIGIVLVFHDCTERRGSDIALMRAEKLAAAGKLAASIAHEVNNPLEGLTNMLYLAAESSDIAEIRRWLQQSQSEVNRISHITRQTLGFYRESTQPVTYRPAEVLQEVLAFYLPEAASRHVKLEAQTCTQQQVYGVPGELRQVLSNLIANSIDAMQAAGVIRLVVRNATDMRDHTRPGVRITVADTGSGIPQHVLGHIFEPFFTTKTDTGTGLGLWVSKELIENYGGRMRVRSRTSGPQIGTVFSIYLPSNLPEAG